MDKPVGTESNGQATLSQVNRRTSSNVILDIPQEIHIYWHDLHHSSSNHQLSNCKPSSHQPSSRRPTLPVPLLTFQQPVQPVRGQPLWRLAQFAQ
eukprot:scaffold167334_cov18-Tisochrysis_lutea.AAC.2